MEERIDAVITELKGIAEHMDSIGDMADVDMALMYLRHLKKRLANR